MKSWTWGQVASGLLSLVWIVYAFRSFGMSLLWVAAFGANLKEGLTPQVRFVALVGQVVALLMNLAAAFFVFGYADSGRDNGRVLYGGLAVGALLLTILAVREGWRQWQDAAHAG